MTRSRHWWILALCACLLWTPAMLAQLQTGNIFGKVQAKDGSVLPGVTVTLSGIGAPQTFVTDTTGSFRFLNLSPGTYMLKAELAGFGTATRQGIGVNIGRNADVTMSLNPVAAESITITAEAPLLDVRKAGSGADVTKVELEKVPSGRDPWVILQQTPGVLLDRINVGGNESGQQSNYVGKGATTSQSTWNVDGVNITDVGALGSSPAYYDFDSFEELQVTTGGSDPRIQTPGVQLNMVTKRGTNDIKGSARLFVTRNAWQAAPQIPAQAQSYLKAANEIDKIDDYGAEAGGPIMKDHLWMWLAYAKQQINLLQASGSVLLPDHTTLDNKNAKVNAQLAASNSFAFAGMYSDKVKFGRNVGPTRPPETGWDQQNSYKGPTMWKAEDTQIFSPNLYLTGLFSKVQGGFQLISDNGQRCTSIECGLSGLPTTFDFSSTGDGLPHNSYYNYFTERPQTQYRADGSTFFNTGSLSHELKFGAGYRGTKVRSEAAWPGDQILFFFDRPGTPGAAGAVQLNKVSDFIYHVNSTDAYAGDTVMIGNATLQAGLRYDGQKGQLSAGTIKANLAAPTLLPSQSYGGGGNLTWNNVSPRLGITYSLGADKRTLLRAAANRYVDQMGGYEIYGASPLQYGYVYMYFTDKNGNKRADPGEFQTTGGPFNNGVYSWGYNIDPSNPANPQSVNRWDKNLKAPTTNEFILGVEHELTSDLVFGATGTYRKSMNFISRDAEKTQGAGDFYTQADYVFVRNVTGTLPNGGPAYSVPFYDLKAGEPIPIYYVFRNRPDYSQRYKGLELALTKRMTNRWMMRANLTLQDWTQSVGPNAFADPSHIRDGNGCSNCDGGIVVQGSGTGSGAKGGVYINSKWAYNLTGAYQIPVVETTLGFNITGRQGYPIPYAIRQASVQGNKQILAFGSVDPQRLPNLNEVDLRLAKDVRVGRAGVTLSVDAFNVMNAHTVLQRNVDAYHSSWTKKENQIFELQSPRVFRLGAKLSF